MGEAGSEDREENRGQSRPSLGSDVSKSGAENWTTVTAGCLYAAPRMRSAQLVNTADARGRKTGR